jgi:hypothetical protein
MDQYLAEELLAVNESLEASLDCEKNEKFLNRIYLNQILGQSPTAYEMDTLDSLARSCVNEVGKAALWAQTFLPDSVNFYREPLMFCEETEELTTGTNNDKYGEEFQLYPVPCHDLIKIQFNKNNDWNKLIVLNTDGKTILDQEISKSCVSEIDVQKFISGIYWIKITNKYGKHFMRKFVKI